MAEEKTPRADRKAAAGTERNGGNIARWVGIGAGIGSAAIAAALLYANRDKLKEQVGKLSKLAEDAED